MSTDTESVAPPPAHLSIPDTPPGFMPVKGGLAKGARPKKAELVAAPDAVDEVRAFVDWAATFGMAAPPQTQMAASLDSACQWSIAFAKAKAFQKLASNEEGIAWTTVRAQMTIMKPLYLAAIAADPSLGVRCPKLTALFCAKSVISKKGISTRRANDKAEANGEPPYHGEIGKKRRRKAEKAAAAEAEAAAAAVTAASTPK
jgi:hypothetical protein